MTASTIAAFLGQGLLTARPATPSLAAGVAAFYYATDTATLYVYANSVWSTVTGGSGGGGLVKIASVTLSAAAPSISFSGIPGTYTDLMVSGMVSSADAAANEYMMLRFNGDTGANYDSEKFGYFSTGLDNAQINATTSGTIANIPAATALAGSGGAVEISIPAYAQAVFMKQAKGTFSTSLGTGTFSQGIGLFGVHWRNTAAVTALSFVTASGSNFIAGSTLTLWAR